MRTVLGERGDEWRGGRHRPERTAARPASQARAGAAWVRRARVRGARILRERPTPLRRLPLAMRLLLRYLRGFWPLVLLALVLATINQVFSLLDPLIFRHIIDRYATRYADYTTSEFFRGVGLLLGAAVGVAFVSRVAKNFQDYFVNVVTQRLGARLYADGIQHSLELPYSVFEDQRSGETLGRLQKVRTDVEKLISTSINVLFTSLVGIIFVMVYAFSVHWLIAPVYFLTVPVLGILS